MDLDSNFFRLMGLPQQFAIDLRALKKNGRELLRRYHPDRFAAATPQEQRLAVQMASHINTAAATLKDPVRRAIHLFELYGGVIDPQRSTVNDADFLLQQMELREEIEQAGQANDKPQLEQLKLEVNRAAESCQQIFDSAPDSGDDKALSSWAAAIGKLQFYQKLNSEISRLLAV